MRHQKTSKFPIMYTSEYPYIKASPIPTPTKSQIFSFLTNPHIKHVPGVLFSRLGKNDLPSREKGGIVGTMGFGPDPPSNKPQQTPSYRSMAQPFYRPKTEAYRGPISGPNHLHLQAGPKHTWPAERET